MSSISIIKNAVKGTVEVVEFSTMDELKAIPAAKKQSEVKSFKKFSFLKDLESNDVLFVAEHGDKDLWKIGVIKDFKIVKV